MASNYSNFFTTLVDERPSFDEFVYGPNYATASSVFTGSNETWFPTSGSTRAQSGVRKCETYVFSAVHFGHMADMFKCPPERYISPASVNPKFSIRKNQSRNENRQPPITVKMTGSYTTVIDRHARIFTRFHDQENIDQVNTLNYTELTF